jgi:hypothetical protein
MIFIWNNVFQEERERERERERQRETDRQRLILKLIQLRVTYDTKKIALNAINPFMNVLILTFSFQRKFLLTIKIIIIFYNFHLSRC